MKKKMVITTISSAVILSGLLLVSFGGKGITASAENNGELHYDMNESEDEIAKYNEFLEEHEGYQCRQVIDGNEVSLHYFSKIDAKPATCQESGYRDKYCEICKETIHEDFPIRDHLYNNGYCIWCGALDPNPQLEEQTEILMQEVQQEAEQNEKPRNEYAQMTEELISLEEEERKEKINSLSDTERENLREYLLGLEDDEIENDQRMSILTILDNYKTGEQP